MKFLTKRPVLFVLLMAWLVLAVGAVHAQSPNNLVGALAIQSAVAGAAAAAKYRGAQGPQLDAPQHYDYRRRRAPRSATASAAASMRPAAAGVRPGRRAAYSRNCANRDD